MNLEQRNGIHDKSAIRASPDSSSSSTHRALANRDTLESNFSKVGENAIIIKESQAVYRVHATGRSHCVGMLAYLDVRISILSPEPFFFQKEYYYVCFASFFFFFLKLRKRQDLFSLVLSSFGLFYNPYDQLVTQKIKTK